MQKIKIIALSLLVLTSISQAANKIDSQHQKLAAKKYMPLPCVFLAVGLSGSSAWIATALKCSSLDFPHKIPSRFVGCATALGVACALDKKYTPWK